MLHMITLNKVFQKKKRKQQETIIEQINQENKPKSFIEQWDEALSNKDKVKMEELLKNQMKHCKNKNSWCGQEMFCPECPFAGFKVQCGRSGW